MKKTWLIFCLLFFCLSGITGTATGQGVEVYGPDFAVTVPDTWSGHYFVMVGDDSLTFYSTANVEAGYSSVIYEIRSYPEDLVQSLPDYNSSFRGEIQRKGGRMYFYCGPSDAPFEPGALQEEYLKLTKSFVEEVLPTFRFTRIGEAEVLGVDYATRHFVISVPNSWNGRTDVRISDDGESLSVYSLANAAVHSGGLVFGIARAKMNAEGDIPFDNDFRQEIMQEDGYQYYRTGPSDVQCIDQPGFLFATDCEDIYQDINKVLDSFEIIK